MTAGVKVAGLGFCCLVFAANSSVLSYLILRYAQVCVVARTGMAWKRWSSCT